MLLARTVLHHQSGPSSPLFEYNGTDVGARTIEELNLSGFQSRLVASWQAGENLRKRKLSDSIDSEMCAEPPVKRRRVENTRVFLDF